MRNASITLSNLDKEAQAAAARIAKRWGTTPDRVVREETRFLAKTFSRKSAVYREPIV
ncbi:MAG: hypothetical protein ACI4TC_08010 [Kiritimatiellia bacterium]